MTIIGIDPGLKGGVAKLTSGRSAIVHDMPIADGVVCPSAIFDWCSHGEDVAYVEHAQAMPGQGVTSMFNYGVGFGKVLAALEIAGVEIKLVRPAVWKKALGLSKDKNASVEMAEKLYPGIQFRTERGRLLDGRAEALLIAHYGMMQETKK